MLIGNDRLPLKFCQTGLGRRSTWLIGIDVEDEDAVMMITMLTAKLQKAKNIAPAASLAQNISTKKAQFATFPNS